MTLECVAIAEAGGLKRGKKAGREEYFRCPLHDDSKASLRIDTKKNLWFCDPCDRGGTAWALAAALADVSADDKPSVTAWLHDRNLTTGNNTSQLTISATYDYVDEAGELVFQVVRLEPKDFRQRRPDGNGGWIWNMGGVSRVPFHLPKLLETDSPWVVEGEKDVLALERIGLKATCNPGGAGKWPPDFARHFNARQEVTILPDNDDPGRAHAEDVARSLSGKVASVKVLVLPGLKPKGGDVSDWLDGREPRQAAIELWRLAEACEEWTPREVEPSPELDTEVSVKFGEHLSDLGNARRLVALHGRDIRFVPQWGWLIWDGCRWVMDKALEINRRALDAVRGIYDEALAAPDLDKRAPLVKHALQSEASPRINALVEVTRFQPEVIARPSDFDQDPWLFNVQNFTINLKTGDFHRNRREDLITKIAPLTFDPAARCPRFMAFLDRIMAGNQDLIRFLQRAFGYAMTGRDDEQVLFIFWGSGQNGKSTALDTIRMVLGDYATTADTSTFLDRTPDAIRNDLADLAGKRFVSAIEIGEGRRLAEKLVKHRTGSDPVKARFLYHEYFVFKPTFKIFLGVNHRPVIRGTDLAIWRRIRLVPFKVIIPDDERILGFADQLLEEKAGILNWLLEGSLFWREQGLGMPTDVKAAIEQYRDDMDVLGDWREACCIVESDAESTSTELYRSYVTYCDQNKTKPVSQTRFGTILTERGFHPDRDTTGKVRIRHGIRLKPLSDRHDNA